MDETTSLNKKQEDIFEGLNNAISNEVPSPSLTTEANQTQRAVSRIPYGTGTIGTLQGMSGKSVEERQDGKWTIRELVGTKVNVTFSWNSGAKLDTATEQFFCFLLMKVAENNKNSRHLRIPLLEYMKARGGISEQLARKQVNTFMKNLKGAEVQIQEETITDFPNKNEIAVSIFEYRGKGRNKNGDEVAVKNGLIVAGFTELFFETYLKHYPLKYFPEELIAINTQLLPYSFEIGKEIEVHRNCTPIGDKARNISRVATLVTKAEMPNEESETAKRKFKERVLIPFERAMDSLTYLEWWYLDGLEKGKVKRRDFYNARIQTKLKGNFEKIEGKNE